MLMDSRFPHAAIHTLGGSVIGWCKLPGEYSTSPPSSSMSFDRPAVAGNISRTGSPYTMYGVTRLRGRHAFLQPPLDPAFPKCHPPPKKPHEHDHLPPLCNRPSRLYTCPTLFWRRPRDSFPRSGYHRHRDPVSRKVQIQECVLNRSALALSASIALRDLPFFTYLLSFIYLW